jgi:hypothetical protein
MTTISVPSGSRGLRDRLRSFNFCTGSSIGSYQRRWMQYPRRCPPHSISLGGFRTPAPGVRARAVHGPASENLHRSRHRPPEIDHLVGKREYCRSQAASLRPLN